MRLISFSILTLTALRIKKNVRKRQRWVFDYLVKFYLTYIIWLASCHDRTLICTRLYNIAMILPHWPTVSAYEVDTAQLNV